MNESALTAINFPYSWHPFPFAKNAKDFKPLKVKRAYDSYIELSDGKVVIDAISSWWCKSLGHNHPELKKALLQQLEAFEHVIFSNTTSEVIEKLSEKLGTLMPALNKVFYAGDGSCAVEIAMKMSVHLRMLQGDSQRHRFIALKNGYHGETLGALSVSDLDIFRLPYKSLLFDPVLIEPLYVSNQLDPAWENADDHWRRVESELEAFKNSVTAILFEPLLQGAGGMKLYSKDFLRRLAAWAQSNDIHLIADEIMTGLGRTGTMLGCEHAGIIPDFICLSKGLTSGWMPFSAVVTKENSYETFYHNQDKTKAFVHSHTYSGNALGASVALATLSVIEQQTLCARAKQLEIIMRQYFEEIAQETGLLSNIRGLGAVMAADWIIPENVVDFEYKFFERAIELGALFRPMGNTLYWMPPLTISDATLNNLKDITRRAL